MLNFMKMNTLNKSFIWGIIFASITWVISLYLYMQLSSTLTSVAISTQFSSPSGKIEQFALKEHKHSDDFNLIMNNEIGESFRKKIYVGAKEKADYKRTNYKKHINSEKLIKSLQPVPPTSKTKFDNGKSITISELNELGMVKTLEDQRIRDNGYKVYAFNALVSQSLSLDRQIPDTRHKLCRTESYRSDLPKTSVIICFFNEHYDTLLRSVHSVLHRTPDDYLHEVILIDDSSDVEALSANVSSFIAKHRDKRLQYINTRRREGLIRARMLGASRATAEVIVFLDSHIEVNVQWLEPLLSHIKQSPKSIAIPIIDIINPDTFAYTASPLVRGGFNWGLHFKWENLPAGTLDTDKDFIKPIKTPTMAGGLFAINRQYFANIGEYDAGMDIWGGENLEISFRVWMCGGELNLIPCSRVGHVFRKRRPYSSPSGEDTMLRNSLRVAHVWMDNYKEFFLKQRPESNNVSFGDVAARKLLRKQLECNDFAWYLRNVYPELVLPGDDGARLQKKWSALEQNKFQPWHSRKRNYQAQYQIRLANSTLCVRSAKDEKSKGAALELAACLRTKKQMWYETDRNELVLAQLLCMDAGHSSVRLSKCHEMGGTQEWKHKGENGTPIYNMAAGTCLAVARKQIGAMVTMELCTQPELSQWDLVL